MSCPKDRARQAGFTLIEIMVVIAIVGLLLTIVGRSVYTNLREAKVKVTQAKIANLKGPISDYRRHYSTVPDDLRVLLEESDKNMGEPYIEDEDNIYDAWETEFVYRKISKSKYEVKSLGADGIEGGEFDDADISSLTMGSKQDQPN